MKLYLPLTEISVHGASRALLPLFLRLLFNQTGTLQFQLVLCLSFKKFISHQEVFLPVLANCHRTLWHLCMLVLFWLMVGDIWKCLTSGAKPFWVMLSIKTWNAPEPILLLGICTGTGVEYSHIGNMRADTTALIPTESICMVMTIS